MCRADRSSPERGQRISAQYRRLFEAVTASSAEVPRWSIYEVYADNILDANTRETVAALPEGAAYQYTVNRSYWPLVRDAVADGTFGRLPHAENILRTHAGSQWNRQLHAWAGPLFAQMAATAAGIGMHGFSIFGEASAYHPPNELGYAAFARFSWDPWLDFDRFRREEVDPRLGGEVAATRFLELLELLEDRDVIWLSDGLRAALRVARDEAHTNGAAFSGEVARRWLWLEERLARRLYARGWGAE